MRPTLEYSRMRALTQIAWTNRATIFWLLEKANEYVFGEISELSNEKKVKAIASNVNRKGGSGTW